MVWISFIWDYIHNPHFFRDLFADGVMYRVVFFAITLPIVAIRGWLKDRKEK